MKGVKIMLCLPREFKKWKRVGAAAGGKLRSKLLCSSVVFSRWNILGFKSHITNERMSLPTYSSEQYPLAQLPQAEQVKKKNTFRIESRRNNNKKAGILFHSCRGIMGCVVFQPKFLYHCAFSKRKFVFQFSCAQISGVVSHFINSTIPFIFSCVL